MAAGLGAVVGSAITAAANESIASANRKWQRRMSNTAYRRSMRDMRKAGLNPILAYKTGGASTPPGAMAQMPDFGESFSRGVASALAVRRQKQELKNMKQTEHKDEALTDQADSAISYNEANEASARADVTLKSTMSAGQLLQNKLLAAQIPGGAFKESFDQSGPGQALLLWERLMGHAGISTGRGVSRRSGGKRGMQK